MINLLLPKVKLKKKVLFSSGEMNTTAGRDLFPDAWHHTETLEEGERAPS